VFWSELRAFVRWLLRLPKPPPPPGTGERIQASEREAARQRILDEARRDRRWHSEPTQILSPPMTQRTGYDAVRSQR
jgi:hypothetical protein